ncbi:hypothetical protein OHS59_04190 [Streptomyces sp. NBC_00414]|uniref:hypothetical protein n=1 Tax=Streptomyces sp. NBC_00414 TaxID=2975739 RepID=UPI002E21BB40
MTTCDEDGRSTVFAARVPGGSRLDDESDCRWCRILLGPGFPGSGSVAGTVRAEPESVWRTGHCTRRVRAWLGTVGLRVWLDTLGVRAWLERTRTVMLPVAAITVLAALTLVTMA